MIKRILFSISAIALTGSIAFAQQPANAGYESWVSQPFPLSYDEPSSWSTTNSLRAAELAICGYTCTATNPVSVYKAGAVNAFAGSDAMKIESKKMPNVPSQVSSFINDTSGFAWIGSVIPSSPYIINGYTMTTRYADFTFNAKYTPTGNDSAFCLVAFLKRNGAVRDTVAYGYQYIHSEAAYKSFTINMTYKLTVNPDTAVIIISATNDAQPKVGSILFVDDLSFSGLVSGINENGKLADWIRVSPNPANNIVTFTSPSNDLSLMEIYDVTGRIVASQVTGNNNALMDVSSLSAGLYTYRAYNIKNEVIGVGKFNISR